MDNQQAQVTVILPADFSEQLADVCERYDVLVIGIDPDDERSDNLPQIEHLQRNPRLWDVECYQSCLAEIYRVLRPGGIFGPGEPMHLDVPLPEDLAPIYTKGGGVGPEGWADCFATVSETANLCCHAGFNILEAGHAPDAWNWWKEFTEYDPHCKVDPQGEARIIRQDGGRWLSYGYVIVQKPSRMPC
ncbi:MAG TPA: hypothetical protein VIR02_18100 [Anaerolineales bacterium]